MRRDAGVTLIEILLSVLILVIGMVGIMAVFPVALEANKRSTDDTQAGIVIESVKHALAVGIEGGRSDAVTNRYIMPFTHDGKTGTLGNLMEVMLPLLSMGTMHYPSGTSTSPDPGLPGVFDPTQAPTFTMNSDVWIYNNVSYIWNNTDLSEGYDQYMFSFDATKINTMIYAGADPNLEARTRMFQFMVHVLRMRRYTSVGTGGEAIGSGTTTSTTGGSPPGVLIQSMVFNLAAR